MAREPDPPTQVQALEAELGRSGLARGYVLRGPEDYFKDRALTLLRNAARGRDAEVCVHDGKDPDFSLSSALDDLAGSALFSSERFVVLRGVDAHLKKTGKEDAGLTRAIQAFLARAGSPGTVVVTSDGMRADHAVVKAVGKAGGTLLSCRKLYDAPAPWETAGDATRTELVQWFLGRCRAAGVAVQREEAALIAAAVGNDLFALETQVEKLKTSGTSAVVDGLGLGAAGKPFQIADDLVAGRLGAGLFALETLFRGGFEQDTGKREIGAPALVAILVSALQRSVRRALAGAEVLARGGDLAAAAQAAGVTSNRLALAAFQKNVEARPLAEWQAMLADTCALDRRAKSGAKPDASDFARLALRWRKRPSGGARGGGRGAAAQRPVRGR